MRTVRDTPSSRWASPTAGTYALGIGLLLVGLLTIVQTAAWMLPDVEPSLATPPLLPPHPVLASWLAPAAADTTALRPTGSLDALLDAAPTTTYTSCRTVWMPSRTAVVRAAYETPLPAAAGCSYRLTDAPPGIVLDETAGALRWTPRSTDARWQPHPVVLEARDASGAGTRYRYDLFVTEHTHWLGTDRHGRDVGLALLYGSRWTLLPGLLAVTVALLGGSLLGSVAGYHGGIADVILRSARRGSMAVPTFILLFVVAVTQTTSAGRLTAVMATLGLLWAPGVAHEVSTRVRALRDRQFIEAALDLGMSTGRILAVEVLAFQARDVLVRRALQGLALAILTETALSFLGLGVIPPDISWGTMIYEGRTVARTRHFALLVLPALALTAACTGFYLLDHGLRMRHAAKTA